MKRTLLVLLCIVLSCFVLVSCAEDEIGSYLENYPESGTTVEKLTLNLYIIVGNETTEDAKTSVARELNAHTLSKFNTVLNVFYVSADSYQETVMGAINNGGDNAPNIILINSASMFNELVEGKKLADLTSYLDGTKYGSLNTQIPKALLLASRISGKYYSVPNNHLIGEYKYLVVNKEIARNYLFSDAKINSYKSLADAQPLIDAMKNDGKSDEDISKAVFEISGPYELRNQYANGYFCNVCVYPTVDANEAFCSAFSVIKNLEEKYNERSMEVIYEINTNKYFRNLLQYGVQDINYTLSDDKVVTRNTENLYVMNLLYTGDVFNAYYCEDYNWTAKDRDNRFKQNEESVVATAEQN